MTSALYLFCLARSGLVPSIEGTGINGTENLEAKDISNVTAVVCEVPAHEFSGSSAETKLQDLAWVGPRAVRHEQVIEEVMSYSPVLPARFGSLFSSVEALERLVNGNLPAISGFLDRVANGQEWAVKGFLSKTGALKAIVSDKIGEVSESLCSLTPGMRYFKERQIHAEAEKELAGWVREACKAVSDELISYSTSCRQRKIVGLDSEESDKQTVVNWAFLVDRSRVPDFLNRVEQANTRCNNRGLFFECSGPWPPYSFTPSLLADSEK
ncbi:MAG: GvpL/GvpF family gas vesicle protein [Desulfomonilaceae bacterium]